MVLCPWPYSQCTLAVCEPQGYDGRNRCTPFCIYRIYSRQHFLLQDSAIATDQSHEENNVSVKGDGRAVELTENPASLR